MTGRTRARTARSTYAAAIGADADALETGEAARGATHLAALTASKVADGLINPKLVLPWLVAAVGASPIFVGLLTPIREAGSMAPQILIAPHIEAARRAKWVWALGAFGQALGAAGIFASVMLLAGDAAGLGVLASLALLAISRAACSASYKDILGRTLPKRRRGRVTGLAGSAAAALVLAVAIALSVGLVPLTVTGVGALAAAAAGLWALSGAIFAQLDEPARETIRRDADAADILQPLVEEPELRRLIAIRVLLAATAFAPAFIVLQTAEAAEGAELGALGPLVVAASLATILGSAAWGRVADWSSKWTLAAAAGAASATLFGLAALGSDLGSLGVAAVIFAIQILYEGVRAGRKLHLTDMADDDDRARFTASSNTVVGALLLAGGALGGVAEIFGASATLALLAAMCAVAVPLALGLTDVQRETEAS